MSACKLKGLVKKYIRIEDSDANSWSVKRSIVDGTLAFQNGWHDFVRDHSITVGLFVIENLHSLKKEIEVDPSDFTKANVDEIKQEAFTNEDEKDFTPSSGCRIPTEMERTDLTEIPSSGCASFTFCILDDVQPSLVKRQAAKLLESGALKPSIHEVGPQNKIP
ncbi:hypothetical protein HPP92_021408 [Vanilla planifolia]|uniref:TF-B3 domain-containing protein n=1 Tax=Vanilla planifolia TaxID=51239 RepID=A0A835UIY1_VANPL|nr:hypothetical protein HPP92_021408 [Vanilla planifolia]